MSLCLLFVVTYRFDISVNALSLMHVPEPETHLPADIPEHGHGERSVSLHDLVERAAVHVLKRHGDASLHEARADEREDVRAAALVEGAQLLHHHVTLVLVEHRAGLERNDSQRRKVERLHNHARLASAEIAKTNHVGQTKLNA